MSTRSRIGIELKNGSILSVYHHWDGYPEWLGRILNTHYNTREKVAELIDGGDMSSAWTNERWTNDVLDRHIEEYGPNYYSYRGEDSPPRFDKDLCEFLLPENSEEFAYLFRNGQWVCYNMNRFDDSKLPEIVEISPSPLFV
jgi:hypothetical protein